MEFTAYLEGMGLEMGLNQSPSNGRVRFMVMIMPISYKKLYQMCQYNSYNYQLMVRVEGMEIA